LHLISDWIYLLTHQASFVLYYNLSCLKIITPWLESASELYRPRDRRLSAKLVPTVVDRGVSSGQHDGSLRTYSRFSRPELLLFLFQAAPQFYLRGLVYPVPDPLLLGKPGSAGNRTRTSGSAARNSDH
jgi:hypothetical protein